MRLTMATYVHKVAPFAAAVLLITAMSIIVIPSEVMLSWRDRLSLVDLQNVLYRLVPSVSATVIVFLATASCIAFYYLEEIASFFSPASLQGLKRRLVLNAVSTLVVPAEAKAASVHDLLLQARAATYGPGKVDVDGLAPALVASAGLSAIYLLPEWLLTERERRQVIAALPRRLQRAIYQRGFVWRQIAALIDPSSVDDKDVRQLSHQHPAAPHTALPLPERNLHRIGGSQFFSSQLAAWASSSIIVSSSWSREVSISS